MKLGYIGLGKMGSNMVLRLLEKGHEPVVYDVNPNSVKELGTKGAKTANSLQEVVDQLEAPRTVWIMVPSDVVDTVLAELIPLLEKRDTIIDGGNSHYKETMRRAEQVYGAGLHWLDMGTSGGPGGARNGAAIMVGGKREDYDRYIGLLKDLCVDEGYGYMGDAGAGHFVKMVHNGIEYGMMQAIGEGFEMMKKSPLNLDLKEIARVYNHGTVVTSRLIGWLEAAFAEYGTELSDISGTVGHTGEGQWTAEAAKELGIPTPIIEGAFQFRVQSKDHPSYTGQVVSALRNQFGGHAQKKGEKIDSQS